MRMPVASMLSFPAILTGIMLAKNGFQTGSWQALLDGIEKARQEAEEAAKLMEV